MTKEKEEDRKDRQSTNPKSSVKGKPKKDGAGGKYTEGAIGSEYFGGDVEDDRGDPNYDSEEEAQAAIQPKKEAPKRNPPSFSALGQRLLSENVPSETGHYVFVISQGEEAPRIIGTYSTYEKARAKVEEIVKFENDSVQAGWDEQQLDTWRCACDFVKISKYPIDPVL